MPAARRDVIAVAIAITVLAAFPVRDAAGADHVRKLRLVERWSAGREDDGQVFGLIPRVDADAEGRVYVLDSQLCEISVFDRDGRLERTLFRRGDGPGELRQPRDFVLMPDGRVGAAEGFPAAIVFVDRAGDPAGRIAVRDPGGASVSLSTCDAAGDEIVVGATRIVPGDRPRLRHRNNVLARLEPDGTLGLVLAANDAVFDYDDFRFSEADHIPLFWYAFDVTGNGVVVVAADRDRLAVEHRGAGGEILRVDALARPPVRRSPARLREVTARIDGMLAALPIPFTLDVEESESAVASMHRGVRVLDDGSVWIMSGRSLEPDDPETVAIFHVFGPDGAYREEVHVVGRPRADRCGVFLVDEHRLLIVEGYHDSLFAQDGDGTIRTVDGQEPVPPAVVSCELVAVDDP
jgi:hypothetical protein